MSTQLMTTIFILTTFLLVVCSTHESFKSHRSRSPYAIEEDDEAVLNLRRSSDDDFIVDDDDDRDLYERQRSRWMERNDATKRRRHASPAGKFYGSDNQRAAMPVTSYVKPDECSPRLEFPTDGPDGKTRSCQRKCLSDSDCLNDRKLCLCDGDCGMSCIRPEKECPELPDPPHGQVHLTGRHFNDRAVYTCDEGYQIVGLDQVICNSDGHWSGAQPMCKQATSNAQSRYYCGEPTHIPNAKHNGSDEQMFYDLDTELTYQCLPGYQRKGFTEAQCFFYNGTARWFGPDLECHPIDCGPPEEILNGKRNGDCTTYRCQIEYECVDGFELVGKDTRYCQSDGTWTPSELPTCVPVQCPIPDSPVNGKAMYTAVAYKSVVSYECKYGFMIVGDATRTCGADKSWTGEEPKCKEINCGSPGYLPNGWLEGSRTTLHAVVTFRCIEGMTFEGQSFRTTCQADGTWSHPLPKCYAQCIVPEVEMGKAINLTVGSPVKHGQNITVNCNANYELASNSTPIVCNNGTWTQIPKCEPARCKSLPAPPLNGMVVVPTTKHGGVGLYQCKDGFVLKGQNTTRCNYGSWSGVTPLCELVYCPFPGYIQGGKVLLVGNMGLYDYRPYVKKVKNNRQIMFECGRGFKLSDGPPGATCIDGRWSPPELPKCTDEFHPKMAWFAKREAPNDPAEEPLILKRLRREILERENLVEGVDYVRRRHRRSKSKPSTGHKDCSELTDENMSIEIVRPGRDSSEASNADGSVLKISCGSGYELSLQKKKVRCKRGEWKPEVPKCIPVKCHLPRLSDDGRGKFRMENAILPNRGEVDHGKEVDLECDEGYFRNGPARLRCWFGEWSGGSSTGFGLPKCVGNPCELPEITGGEGKYIGSGGSYRPGQVIPHNALINYTCSDDKSRASVNTVPSDFRLQCKLGRLVPHQPHCGSGLDPKKAIAAGFGNWFGLGTLDYSASSHIYKNGDMDLSSTGNDVTNPLPSVAKLVDTGNGDEEEEDDSLNRRRSHCPPPNKVNGSLVYKGDSNEPLLAAQGFGGSHQEPRFPHGTEVRFDCLKLQNKKNSDPLRSWKIFCHDGQWSGVSLSCDENGNPLTSEDLGNAKSSFNASCPFKPLSSESNVVAFYEDRRLTGLDSNGQVENFEPGAEVVFRCGDIGKYMLQGSSRRRCIGGHWDGVRPTCVGLSQHFNYSSEKPPTILFRHMNGQIAQSNDGQLVVTPGTVVHMECLWVRKLGSPEWEINNYSGRTYPQGWTTDPGRDAQLEYRLSIYHARTNDTGTYTCKTPTDQSHSVDIIVKEVVCPEITMTKGLSVSDTDRNMNARVRFSCTNGNGLIGVDEVRCLPSGRWSSPIPACMNIVCPENITSLAKNNLRVHVHSFAAGGIAYFSCSRGNVLHGVTQATCRETGEWSVDEMSSTNDKSPVPTCRPIMCPKLQAPENGAVSADGPVAVGQMVKFHCNAGHMMEGQPISTCTERELDAGKRVGHWSSEVPRCVKACTYPGSVIGGMIDDVRFYYGVGDKVRFDCAPGLSIHGAKMLECLASGIWSGSMPTCGKPTTGS